MQPALAATSIPPNQDLLYIFAVRGDATAPGSAGGGEIHLSVVPTSPFASFSLLEGQSLYQNVNALVTTTSDPLVNLVWQVHARNQNASVNGKFFADTEADGHSVSPANWCILENFGRTLAVQPTEQQEVEGGCPSLVSEWQLRCPMALAVSPPPPVVIPDPIPPTVAVVTPQPLPVASPPVTPACTPYVIGTFGATGMFELSKFLGQAEFESEVKPMLNALIMMNENAIRQNRPPGVPPQPRGVNIMLDTLQDQIDTAREALRKIPIDPCARIEVRYG